MVKKINRREFLLRSAGSLAGLTLAGTFTSQAMGAILEMGQSDGMLERVPLGNTGLVVSRLAMGTGTVGTRNSSNQTRAGMKNFVEVFRRGYERGARFSDMAEGYGSMPFVGEAIKGLPRENLVLLSKIWTHPDDSPAQVPVRPKVEEYLRQTGTDYLDVLLLHCLTAGDWDKTRTHYMEGLSRAKEDGLVRRVGISCHNLEAMRTAATHPWVDVIMARINPFGSKMDGPVAEVEEVLRLARDNGKGVVGMKIFGEGTNVTEGEREQSLRHAIHSSSMHAMTIGFETVAQLDDAVDRIIRISGER
jgi:aryl-alcohol dehydrogenase-like predicted oxidoreductase